MKLSRNEWKFACFAVITICGIFLVFASCELVNLADDYKRLNDDYDMMADVIEAKNHEIADLNKKIEELESQLPQ